MEEHNQKKQQEHNQLDRLKHASTYKNSQQTVSQSGVKPQKSPQARG